METRKMQLALSAGALALSLALAGCGGGGSSATALGGDPLTPQETCENAGGRYNADASCTSAEGLLAERQTAQRSAIHEAINEAGALLAVVTGAGAAATEEQIAAAEAEVVKANTAIRMATDLAETDINKFKESLLLIDTPLMKARNELDLRVAQAATAEAARLAREAATKAREAANRAAELQGPNSQVAMNAHKEADAADKAANEAEAANANAMADTVSDDAEAEQATAEARQATAEMKQTAAEGHRRVAEGRRDATDLALIIGYREAAMTAKNEAIGHYEAAKQKAADARQEATNARMAANRAMAARTNYADADKYAGMAEAKANAAEAARDRAMTASMDANNAYMAAMAADVEVDAAKTARDTAQAQNRIATEAHTGTTGAGMAYMDAKTYAGMADNASGEHVLGLLMAANAVKMTDAEDRADAVMAVARALEVAAAATGNHNGTAVSTAAATWPANTPADPDASPPTEEVVMPFMVAVAPEGGTALTFRTKTVYDDPSTPSDEYAQKTANPIDKLGAFMRGYSITDNGTHAIVFTDKAQDDAPVEARDAVTFREVENVEVMIDTVTKLGTKSGNMYTGAEYTPTNEAPLMGSLTCPSGATCTVDVTTAADGTVTINSISGYVFTGSREAKAAVVACDAACQAAANDYLVFGYWLQEDGNADNTANDPQFGAFMGGARTAPVAVEITGMATYAGSATGLYTAGESVDYFEGAATLKAKFGLADVSGTITGTIDDIVAGGQSMENDVIHLNSGTIGSTGEITDGMARMGTPEVEDLVATYPYNGSWSGRFYNGTADNSATTDVNESHVAPRSVAGTFGVTGTMGEGDDAVTRSYVGAFGAHIPQ